MKYVVTLFLGFVLGVLLFAAGAIYNPLTSSRSLSPLTVSRSEVVTLTFSAVPADSIAYTNNGDLPTRPHPEKVLQLWESPIRLTAASVSRLRDARGQTAGIGIKFASRSEATRLFYGEALVDSVWYLYLPGRGSLFVRQQENLFDYLRSVVIPAYRSPAGTWKGNWNGDTTAGPGALGTAEAIGGSGEFAGITMRAVESLGAKAYSTGHGLIAADGMLSIELPDQEAEVSPLDET